MIQINRIVFYSKLLPMDIAIFEGRFNIDQRKSLCSFVRPLNCICESEFIDSIGVAVYFDDCVVKMDLAEFVALLDFGV